MKTLTSEQQKQIQNINATFESRRAAIDERRNYRMENYYNCVDDYSFGGICDQADNQQEDRYRTERDILIEQVENNGYYYRDSSFYRLRDDNGNVANGANDGQYGPYFAINGKFIGVPKKVSTLIKKGYTLELVTRKYKCIYKGFSSKGNLMNRSMECVEETISEVTQESMPDYIGSLRYIDFQFEEYFS